MRDIIGQPKIDNGGEDSFSLIPAFRESQKRLVPLISHSISGHFSIRQGDWKLCLSADGSGWSAQKKMMQNKDCPRSLFNLKQDKAEKNNLQAKNKTKVQELIELLDTESKTGGVRQVKKYPMTAR